MRVSQALLAVSVWASHARCFESTAWCRNEPCPLEGHVGPETPRLVEVCNVNQSVNRFILSNLDSKEYPRSLRGLSDLLSDLFFIVIFFGRNLIKNTHRISGGGSASEIRVFWEQSLFFAQNLIKNQGS